MQIDPGAEKILKVLEQAGYEAYIVGGCVRDALMGREPNDWDITTNAYPEEVKALFRKTFDTGIQHGTVTVLENGGSYEVTTYRIDGEYTDHRRPDSVQFASSLYEDVARRDFTINAMAYHPSVGLVDYFEGQEDLEKRLIRCVGDPMQRFEEDALRMLRAVRFSAKLSFTIDDATYQAIRTLSPTLERVSKERIMDEVTKTLLSDHPEGLEEAARTGLMRYFASGASEEMKDGSIADFVSPAKVKKDRALRFAALLERLTEEEAGRYLKELKSDNDLLKAVRHFVAHSRDERPMDERTMRHFLHQVGKDKAEDLLALRYAIGVDTKEQYEDLVSLYENTKHSPVALAELSVNGRSLLEIGGVQGKQIGAALDYLMQCVLDEPSLNEKETLIRIYKEKYTGKENNTNE